ncbi:MAG: flagellar basal-body rod protein FlgF [Gammaproteobacteria bacterium]|nr:flagellar basal-body rod protein FlgF [Gammaproteobacteria bacterium]
MDRLIYLAMSGAKQTLAAQAAVAHNLANATTTGFRADFNALRSMPVYGDGLPSRVYAMDERPGIDFAPGALHQTGNDLDLALDGDGFIAVLAPDGTEAYTRAGDLHLDGNGLLTTAAGHPVLGNGGPIAVPPAEKLAIAADGTISIRPLGQGVETLAQVDRIKLVRAEPANLVKGADGLLRRADGGNVLPDATVRVVQGALESSNVNSVDALVQMIALQRQFELQVKAMRTAEQNDSAAAQLLRLG